MSMAAYFQSENLNGFANWMKAQATEEMAHATRFYNYINDKGGRVLLAAIAQPDTKWSSPLAAFQAAYKHEVTVTERINKLFALARKENDSATEIMLQWFITEQIEEEASADEIVQKLKLMKDAPGALFMLDRELGQRGAAGASSEE